MGKRIRNFDDTETKESKFHQYQSAILINDIDINQVLYLISFLLVNKIFKILFGTKIIKKLDLYTYSFQK